MKKRKPRIGFMVCTSMKDITNPDGTPFPVMGMAEIAARKLEENNIEVIRYKELIKGDIKDWRVENYNREAVVDTHTRSLEAFDKFNKEDVDCVVMFFSSWAWSHIYLQGMNIVNKPIIIWAGDEMIGCEGVGFFSMKGTLDSVCNIEYKDVYGTPDKDKIIKEAVSYIKAAMVKNILRRSKFGQWGSNPMGMLSCVLDDVIWFRKFGVIAEHLESQTILSEALRVSDSSALSVYNELKNKVVSIPPFEGDLMKKDIKFYIAHKELIEKYDLDFDGIKGVPELSDYYCGLCLAQILLSNEGFVSAYEASPKGALTEYIIRMLTDDAIWLHDIEQVDTEKGIIRLAYDFAPLGIADERGVEILKCHDYGEGKAGKFNAHLFGKKGKVTLARLQRWGDDYVMQLARGTAIESEQKYLDMAGYPNAALATIKLEGDSDKFRKDMRGQFNHICWADIYNELLDVCKILKINVLTY